MNPSASTPQPHPAACPVGSRRPEQVDGRDGAAFDGRPGWPRPYYEVMDGPYIDEQTRELLPAEVKRKFVQYITSTPDMQIFDCDADRLRSAYTEALCSSCGLALEAMPDQAGWLLAADLGMTPEAMLEHMTDDNRWDGHIGSSMCSRCAVFASKACPHFARLLDSGQLVFWRVDGELLQAAFELTEEGMVNLREDAIVAALQTWPRHTLAQLREGLSSRCDAWKTIG